MDRQPARPTRLASLARDTRGAVFAEYVTVLGLVTLAGAVAIAALGIPLVRLFRHVQMSILLPFP